MKEKKEDRKNIFIIFFYVFKTFYYFYIFLFLVLYERLHRFLVSTIDIILRGYYHDKICAKLFAQSGKDCSFVNEKFNAMRDKGSDAGRDDRREEIDVC